MSMERTIEDYIERYSLLAGVNSVVLAVSGGPDSMALAHFMLHHYPQLDYLIAHVDHGLRASSAEEACFVRDWARRQDVACVIKTADVNALASAAGRGVEEMGRAVRYEFFRDQCRDLIMTAHHKGDQAETVLAHMLRGCGLAGLAGMMPRANDLARPLLCVDKDALLAYCHQYELPYILDPSNDNPAFLRNRLRHEVLPLLASMNPRTEDALCRLAEQAAEEEALLASMAAQIFTSVAVVADEGVSLYRKALLRQPVALQRRLVRLATEKAGGSPLNYDLTCRTLALTTGKQLPWGGLTIRCEREKLLFLDGGR